MWEGILRLGAQETLGLGTTKEVGFILAEMDLLGCLVLL